jgi:predicted SnoaL-like aldol condensation-catalyzing enzyme
MTNHDKSNVKLVLEAFDLLFNRKDFQGAEEYWSADYIQHSAHVPAGREGLFELVKRAPADFRYENAIAMGDGNMVMLHGRFRNVGQPRDWIVADIVRVHSGMLVEHWDVIQPEATRAESLGGHPMFGDSFPLLVAGSSVKP